MNRSRSSIFILLALSLSCEEKDDPSPIHTGLLATVRYVKLSLADASSTGSMIANGINSVQLSMELYDKNKGFLYKYLPYDTKISVDGKPLPSPFTYTTKVAGLITFTLEDYPKATVLDPDVTVLAIDDKTFDEVTLPVIFHYIARPGTVPNPIALKPYVDAGIKYLNWAYHNQSGSQNPNAVSSYLTFVAAETDPDGTALDIPGFRLVESSESQFTDSGDNDLHNLIWDGNYWAPKKYINVWVAEFAGNLSWANFPASAPSNGMFPNFSYGVFYNVKHFGAPYVLAHEIGHMLNLLHNFDPLCTLDVDHCPDTQDYKRAYDGSAPVDMVRTSCSGERFTSVNYMDYSPTLHNTFTYDQRERMRSTIEKYPWLPTPLNGGRAGNGRSNSQMKWRIAEELMVW